jgi:hypothetical protein
MVLAEIWNDLANAKWMIAGVSVLIQKAHLLEISSPMHVRACWKRMSMLVGKSIQCIFVSTLMHLPVGNARPCLVQVDQGRIQKAGQAQPDCFDAVQNMIPYEAAFIWPLPQCTI